jgi:hypothetical protein
MLIDLQLHSTYSDGFFTPTEAAKFVAGQGVKVAALTDHNTVGGLDEFRRACRQYNIKPITGIEVYAKLNHHKFNLLWFNFDDRDPELHKLLRESQQRRRSKVRDILKKLARAGYKINIDKIIDRYNHYIPVNRLAQDIYTNSYNRAKTNKKIGVKKPRQEEIIKEYFRNKKIGVLRETYIDIKRILKLRKKIGGQLVINHPAKYGYINLDLMKQLKKMGVDGIEVLSPHHSIGAVMYIQDLAYELGFIEIGSSDFHLNEGGKFLLQNSWQYFKIDSKYLRGIKKIIG